MDLRKPSGSAIFVEPRQPIFLQQIKCQAYYGSITQIEKNYNTLVIEPCYRYNRGCTTHDILLGFHAYFTVYVTQGYWIYCEKTLHERYNLNMVWC